MDVVWHQNEKEFVPQKYFQERAKGLDSLKNSTGPSGFFSR
tara:strand:- start:167 stop:289 length:123 start_codon:yes stop_codon:yes gene_type:complete